jgi:hypothetical protein
MVLKLLGALAGAYLLMVVLAFLFQRKLTYFPDPTRPPLPQGPRYGSLREVELTAEDGTRLEAWYWPGDQAVTVVVFHGNASNRLNRLPWMEILRGLGAGVFMLDYRGFGGSEGTPSERGLYMDGDAAVAWVREHAPGELVFLGQSLGGGVAVEMAARHRPAALVLQNASIAVVATARRHYPYLPVGWLMRDRFDGSERIGLAGCPLLSIHGERDRVVPIELGRALFEAAREPKEFWAVQEASHGDLADVAGEEYSRRVGAFLRAHTALR